MTRGRIDDIGSLATLDVVGLAGGPDAWPAGGGATGFSFEAPLYRQTVRRWGFANLGHVVDAGSGFGRWSVFLAEVNDQVVGYEWNEKLTEAARRLAALLNFTNLTFEAADLAELKAADGSVDGVWCYNVLHATNRRRALREFSRVLRPGGRLAILGYNGIGRVLEKLQIGLRLDGLRHPTSQFALRALRGGSLYNGPVNYGAVGTIQRVLAQFGFELQEQPVVTPEQASQCELGDQEVASLVHSIETDAGFRAEFTSNHVFDALPSNIDLLAVKARDLA